MPLLLPLFFVLFVVSVVVLHFFMKVQILFAFVIAFFCAVVLPGLLVTTFIVRKLKKQKAEAP